MGYILKPGKGNWLYDEVTGDVVGFVDADGGEAFFARTQTNPDGSQSLMGPGGVVRDYSQHKNQLVTVAVGNSISAQDKYDNTNKRWSTKSVIQHANELSGAPMRFKRVTASTRTDVFGVYAYDGQTIATILGDLPTQFWTPLQTAAVVPDLILALSLTENSISGGATSAAINADILAFVRDCQSRFPGVRIILGTPHPSFSNNTAAEVLVYQEVRDYILSLDNGIDVLVCRNDVYENPVAPGTPLGTSGSPIWTDASVHPNSKGGMELARSLASTLRRIGYVFKAYGYGVVNNPSLDGTQAATGTNVSGTKPTGVGYAGDADGVYVLTAEQPGLLYQITCASTAGPAPLDHGSMNFATITVPSASQLSPFVEVEVVSGAENIYTIQDTVEIVDGGGTRYINGMQQQTSDAEPVYQNGDVLTIMLPPDIPASGAITQAIHYFKVRMKLAGGTAVVRIRKAGALVVA